MDTSRKTEKSSKETNTQSHIEPVFALIDSGHNTDETLFHPKADEKEYCNKCNEVFHRETVVTVVVETETFYEEDDYKYIDHKAITCDDASSSTALVSCLGVII